MSNHSTATPLDTISFPLSSLSGTCYESVSNCVDGGCPETNSDYFVFSIDSLTRGFGPKSVPEPGTLGLLATAMMFSAAMRRRRRALTPLS